MKTEPCTSQNVAGYCGIVCFIMLLVSVATHNWPAAISNFVGMVGSFTTFAQG